MKKIALMIPFLVATVAIQANEGLVLRIRQPNDEGQRGGCYVRGDRIPMQLEITNEGAERVSVRIIDHDRAGNPEPYPYGLKVRVTDGQGQVLTVHDLALDGEGKEWWSSFYIKSTLVMADQLEQPGNTIDLAPGERIRRVYDVAAVAGGCVRLLSGFPPGRYVIELRLEDLHSNPYEIVVLSEGETCK